MHHRLLKLRGKGPSITSLVRNNVSLWRLLYSVRSWRCTKWSGSLPMNNAPGKLCTGRPACQLELLRFCPEEPIRSRSSLALPALVTKCGPLALEQRACRRHHLFLNAPRWAHGRGGPRGYNHNPKEASSCENDFAETLEQLYNTNCSAVDRDDRVRPRQLSCSPASEGALGNQATLCCLDAQVQGLDAAL